MPGLTGVERAQAIDRAVAEVVRVWGAVCERVAIDDVRRTRDILEQLLRDVGLR